MASCQSLTYVDDEMIGDPLEMKMLQDTQWILKENLNSNSNTNGGQDDIVLAEVVPQDDARKGLSIIKRFDFESKL
jgi:AAA+ superfamily predicted ATPase